MLIAVIPIVILIVGLLMYVLASNPKVAEIGRIMFFCGMLAVCLAFSSQTVNLGYFKATNATRLV